MELKFHKFTFGAKGISNDYSNICHKSVAQHFYKCWNIFLKKQIRLFSLSFTSADRARGATGPAQRRVGHQPRVLGVSILISNRNIFANLK
jgi:hypothetical protein